MGKNNVNKNSETITAGFYYKNWKMGRKCRSFKNLKIRTPRGREDTFVKV